MRVCECTCTHSCAQVYMCVCIWVWRWEVELGCCQGPFSCEFAKWWRQCVPRKWSLYTERGNWSWKKKSSRSHTHTHTECVYERKREEREEERALENEFLIPFIHETLLHLPVLWIFNSSLIYTKYSSTHQTNHTLLQASLG